MRLMADTTDHSAPPGYDLYAGYIDGRYRSYPFLAAQYGVARTVSITVLGDPAAQVVDVETGDVTPAHAPAWVKAKGSDVYMIWVAAYGVGRCPLAGAVAWQRQDHGPTGENIDISEVYDDGWPHALVPTIYCPYSWAGDVLQRCAAAGLEFVPAGAVPPAPPPEVTDVAKFVTPSPPTGQGMWVITSQSKRYIASTVDSDALANIGEVPDKTLYPYPPDALRALPDAPGTTSPPILGP